MQVTATAGYSFDPQLTLRVGDPAEEAAALAVQGSLQSEATQNDIAQSEEQVAVSESNAQVQAMRGKADDVRIAGIVEGCVGMAAGGLQGAAAACDAAAGNAAAGTASSLRADGEWFKAGATGLESGGKFIDALEQGSELDDDAAAKAAGDAADRATQAAKQAHDAASAEQAVVSSALQSASESQQAVASTNLALAQRV